MDEIIREQLALYLSEPTNLEAIKNEIKAIEKCQSAEPQEIVKGKRDPRNPLNDLTGAEWVYFLNSVETTAYSTKGVEGYSHDLRKIHPSPKPPQLMKKLVEFFTKRDGWVLDPFVGVGGTLLGCSLCDRNGVGIDLEQRYLDTYLKVCEKQKLQVQTVVCGDSRNVNDLITENFASPPVFDLLLTDPPYGDMMARAQTGESKKRSGVSEATPFTDSNQDLGNLPKAEFLAQLRGIIASSVAMLKPNGYCVVFCKDFQPTAEHHNMLHAEVVEELLKIEGLRFRGYKIWYDRTPKLYPFGYPFAFVANQLHQYILIFRKEIVKTKKTKHSG